MIERVFGFKDWDLEGLASRLSDIFGVRFESRYNISWGDYEIFEEEHLELVVVTNSIPTEQSDHEETAEPKFLDYTTILYLSADENLDSITEQTLAIPTAALLREKP